MARHIYKITRENEKIQVAGKIEMKKEIFKGGVLKIEYYKANGIWVDITKDSLYGYYPIGHLK